jgi:diguanylate cyclase (GGDEF)-like protein/PAS domain S-box-containing protein
MGTGIKKNPVVLVADDDFTIRLLALEALEQAGFDVEEAEDGKQALDIFYRVRPDIVLLDVKMPGMNGFEVCAALRKRPEGRNVPILMITGVDDVDSIQRAYDEGATDFMNKPLNWLILTQRVRYMLRASQNVEQLRKSQASLATAQQVARLGSWELDVSTEEFLYTDEIRQVYGFKDESQGFEQLKARVHPDDQQELRHFMDRARYRGMPFQMDHRLVFEGGTERIVQHQVDTILDENGKTRQLIGTVQDITQRKRGEYFEVARNQVLEMIIQNSLLKDILNQLVHVVEQQYPGSLCFLSTLRDNRIHIEAGSALPEPMIRIMDGEKVAPSTGCCSATAAYTGSTVILNNIGSNPMWVRYHELALIHHINAGYAVPIVSGKGQILGTITVFYPHLLKPNEADLSILETIGKLAAVAIERNRLAQQLEHQSRHDFLTDLPNRAAITEQMRELVKQTAETGEKLAVFVIDLDRFKQINDSLGHHIGDKVLKAVTDRFKKHMNNHLVGRMGGDEFIYVMAGVGDREDVSVRANKILELLSAGFDMEGRMLYIAASIGICVYPEDGEDVITLQRNADTAMHYAKNRGGARFHFYTSEMNEAAIERLEIENELRKAIENKEFELHYQPKYEFKTRRINGFEALLRWNHPELGRVPPGKFIPIAEESELIIPIGTWVLQEACRQNAEWEAAGYGQFRIAVNVSVAQFNQDDFVYLVDRTLREHNLLPDRLELEITESMVVNDVSVVTERLSELRKLGVIMAIDDFGTGYSSMSYLHELPVDTIKIDRSFVQKVVGQDLAADKSRKLLRSIVALAKELNLTIVAEGPESPQQVSFLNEIGCDYAQGYYFSVPLSVEEIERKFKEKVSLVRRAESDISDGENDKL